MNDGWLILAAVPVGLFLIYLVARFIFAAYFKSKEDFLRSNKNGREN